MFGYEIDVAYFVNTFLDIIIVNYGDMLRTLSAYIEVLFEAVFGFLIIFPNWVLILTIALITWKISDYTIAIFTLLSLTLIAFMGLWSDAVDTIVLILFSTIIALVIALPIGLILGISDKISILIRPILDLMQTLPAFVYLIPAVMFFGVGKVPAIFATLIFTVPPPIRLTNLGIRQINPEIVEAANAFGSTRWQTLFKIQLPLALPSIKAGVNQCIMLSLAMATIASMIGAGGLGGEVLYGINRLNPGHGFEAGISIVILAIIFDRIAAGIHVRA